MGRKQRDEEHLAGDGITISTSSAVVTMDVTRDGDALGPQMADGEAVTTSTISRWLRVNVEGTTYFVPMWT